MFKYIIVTLNDTLLVGPTVHSSLVDVLIRFRLHRVALTTDVSRMYRAVLLVPSDRDLNRFVWRSDPSHTLKDYRMTRLTFGVNASSFVANMSVKQNARDHALEFPLAAKVVDDSFYVDDGLTGADSVEGAVKLQNQLQDLFGKEVSSFASGLRVILLCYRTSQLSLGTHSPSMVSQIQISTPRLLE